MKKLSGQNTSSLIAALRSKHSLSTTQLAHRLGVSQSTVVRMEQSERSGGISIKTLKRVAEALGYSFFYKFSNEHRVGRAKKEYSGMLRLKGFNKVRRRRSVNDAAQAGEQLRAARFSSAERLLEACSLSDMGMVLGRAVHREE